ncbi:hypothetical protein PG987_013785 [Apiospora arundinis]
MWHDPATPALSSSICMPPDFLKLYGYHYGFYSPGICPLGYTEGCAFPTSLAVKSNGTPFLGGTLLPGETARICCPTGFTCYIKDPSIDADKSITSASLLGSLSTFEAYDYGAHSYITSTAAAKAFAIQVRWQRSDLSKLETDPTAPGFRYPTPKAAPSMAPSRVSVVTTGPAATKGTLDDGDLPRDGLSKESIIALSTALPLASLVLGTLAYFVWNRRHYRTQQSEKSTTDECEGMSGFLRDGQQSAASVSPLTPCTTDFETNSMAELDHGTVSEMDAEKPTYEADPDAHPGWSSKAWERMQELPHMFVADLEGNQPRSPVAAHGKP